jgi:PKD repeat protein
MESHVIILIMKGIYIILVFILVGAIALSACIPGGDGGIFSCGSSEPEVTPLPPGPVRADFYASETTQQGTGRISFYSTSTGPVKEWLWDLNGNQKIDANGPEASFYYVKNGHFTVSLTVEGWDGSTDTMVKKDYIYIYGCSA